MMEENKTNLFLNVVKFKTPVKDEKIYTDKLNLCLYVEPFILVLKNIFSYCI